MVILRNKELQETSAAPYTDVFFLGSGKGSGGPVRSQWNPGELPVASATFPFWQISFSHPLALRSFALIKLNNSIWVAAELTSVPVSLILSLL